MEILALYCLSATSMILNLHNMSHTQEQGFTLLYAMLIITMVLIASSAILSISMKELRLSVVGRDAAEAYYAAESGYECAVYWARQSASTYQCLGQSGSITNFTLTFPNGSCATVQTDTTNRVVTARGYNTCASGAANRVERGKRAIY